MHHAAIATCKRDGDAALAGQGLAQRVPAVVDGVVLELGAQHVHEVVGQHADEQVALDAAVDLVIHRAQAQVGLKETKGRSRVP